ncbi:glycosyltransferase family 2 protein [Methylocystis echinoides]|uniref:Glycosyl transferase n=1 Tax=Methylocystis echinoides TaxID=29468 RepID=A0A9W6LQY3_9HYPH|nr:glycosyltransferase family 2 protein [Methylocystis echinoides]GLI91851.1 glycosyl transferase [Methylocystis echinoides]
MKIAVAIATTGRPEVVSESLARLMRQSRRPDSVLIVGAAPSDAPAALQGAQFTLATTRGLAAQRNLALDLIGDSADVVVFIDDDYVAAPGFVTGVEALFAAHADVVAASGALIADGILRGGLSFAQADDLIADYVAPGEASVRASTGTYGCNMAFRRASAPHLRFDENLPLYGWLEDTDFSARYARFGRVVRCDHFAGVHLGVRSGRVSGLRLGYSQIANPLYLLRKGTATPAFALTLAARNLLANAVKSIRPEPDVDRRGRLRGNLLALADLLRGRTDPRRILEL